MRVCGLYAKFCYIYNVAKSLALKLRACFGQKRKPIDFAMCVAESKHQFARILFVVQPLATI